MIQNKLVEFSVNHPRLIIFITLLLSLLFGLQFPKATIDTDPKHMLPATSPVRVYNDQVEKWFGLYPDTIVLGIYNKDGIFNKDTLENITKLTGEILKMKGVAVRDVTSFTTADNVFAQNNDLQVLPLLQKIPQTQEEMEVFKSSLYNNPLLVDRLISKDGTTTAIYVPLEEGANGKVIADQLKKLVRKSGGAEEYYIAGDPVARDTFGAQMFTQMAVFSPLAGMLMFIALFIMFRNFNMVILNMSIAMISIIWSMGLLIGLKFPVHIMSSMIPVFLMSISTDSIHIFNEFCFRFRELKEKKPAIIDTMKVVGAPVSATAMATAAGFACLAFGHIIPVKVFGIFIAFGTLVIRLMSFTLIPAVLSMMKDKTLLKISQKEDIKENPTSRFLRKLGELSVKNAGLILVAGLVLLTLAIIGTAKIRINNNMVSWFKEKSEIRKADAILNSQLGGTSLGYLIVSGPGEDFFKKPGAMKYLESLQREVEKSPLVGKTTSVADYVKRINRVLHKDSPEYETIPDSGTVISQYLFLFGMSAKQSVLNNVIDYPFQKANIWVQLKTWDASAMREVINIAKNYTLRHPMPELEVKPAGIAYFNMVWNDEVLYDMIRTFIFATILVLFILILEFKSFRWGIISIIPLIFAILLVYGFIGFTGKDFDMPISVLSTLTLGMAIDFAIHFASRFKRRYMETQEPLEETLYWTVSRPGRGIIRNAVLFALGFSVMAFASLTPYITVGLFIMSTMLLSAITTLVFLPVLIKLFPKFLLFKKEVPK
ncbi:MAG: MMPL family transporter [Firmicutes bacterium]|nr:MMPL family transporter [Bacillota bacterium]